MNTASLAVDAEDGLDQRAEQLLDLWSSLSMQHVALGAGCACGMGGISLRLDDFELDIVDYLIDAGVRSGVAEVVTHFTAMQQRAEEGQTMGSRAHPLRRLLEEVHRERLPSAVSAWLVPKLERTLHSYAELHGPKLEG